MKIIKTFNRYIQFERSFGEDAVLALLDNIERVMRSPWRILKDDRTSTVVVVEWNQEKWVIKRANTKSIFHACRRAFLPSRASKNWKNAKKLQSINIQSLEPIAMLEERFGVLKKRSYFICRYIDAVDALHFFTHRFEPVQPWQTVAENICKMIETLAKHRVSHRDLNLSNILIKDEQPILIDLDAMQSYRFDFLAKRAAAKEKARFMENWDETPSINSQIESLFERHLYKLSEG